MQALNGQACVNAPQLGARQGRDAMFGRALLFLRWASMRRTPFTVHDVVAVMNCHKRSAYRYLESAESARVIELVREPSRCGKMWSPGEYHSVIALRDST